MLANRRFTRCGVTGVVPQRVLHRLATAWPLRLNIRGIQPKFSAVSGGLPVVEE
jgi:hypothetical protein